MDFWRWIGQPKALKLEPVEIDLIEGAAEHLARERVKAIAVLGEKWILHPNHAKSRLENPDQPVLSK